MTIMHDPIQTVHPLSATPRDDLRDALADLMPQHLLKSIDGMEDCDCIEILIPVGQIRAAFAALAKATGDPTREPAYP
jgi:L-asparaginase II